MYMTVKNHGMNISISGTTDKVQSSLLSDYFPYSGEFVKLLF